MNEKFDQKRAPSIRGCILSGDWVCQDVRDRAVIALDYAIDHMDGQKSVSRPHQWNLLQDELDDEFGHSGRITDEKRAAPHLGHLRLPQAVSDEEEDNAEGPDRRRRLVLRSTQGPRRLG